MTEHNHTTIVSGCYRCDLNKDEMHAQATEKFKIGDKIAAAVLTYKHAALRVGVIEKIHPPTGSIPETRFTIRDENNRPCVVSSVRSVLIEADEHHTMKELYEHRMVYNAIAALHFDLMHGKAGKSWLHHDGEPPSGKPRGTWFIVYVLTPDGWVTNHYKGKHWDMFPIEEHEVAPEWDGHTPAMALERLKAFLAAVGSS